MLKTALAIGPSVPIKVSDQKQDSKRIQMENQDEKELTQKNRKSEQTAKSK